MTGEPGYNFELHIGVPCTGRSASAGDVHPQEKQRAQSDGTSFSQPNLPPKLVGELRYWDIGPINVPLLYKYLSMIHDLVEETTRSPSQKQKAGPFAYINPYKMQVTYILIFAMSFVNLVMATPARGISKTRHGNFLSNPVGDSEFPIKKKYCQRVVKQDTLPSHCGSNSHGFIQEEKGWDANYCINLDKLLSKLTNQEMGRKLGKGTCFSKHYAFPPPPSDRWPKKTDSELGLGSQSQWD
ncbi:hypothetical protein AMATHDRAFT_45142 [Amanita thiersii Skay4041]|uniref:Uncharacterized protein n=1 Tax=Amanita thiersii Skay4041 TaxID=703135 RepID=A0A2A9NW85_9AGAR|nr:hypothetical protein AMATHDRAFT_45142 [Amanita thiersii Skay4041]